MKIGIIKESAPFETRVAAVPETVAKMIKAGMQVLVQASAGNHAGIHDADYTHAGATVLPDAQTILSTVDILLKVRAPTEAEALQIKEHAILIAPLYLAEQTHLAPLLQGRHIQAFALERIPRIARAQSMDILSSMSSIAGYKAVLMAANESSKLFPMMTTAAGTIPPAKVIVIGAGVAGLQAIATARRLGAVVLGFDTRPAAGEQVKSLGAEFVSLGTTHEQTQNTQGYATAQSIDFYQHEQTIIAPYLAEADAVITTALVPAQRAPLLITAAMVQTMKPGAVIVDLAAEQQGNCALTQPGKTSTHHGVTIIGALHVPALVPAHASLLFARNVLSFLNYITPQLNTTFDLTDDIIRDTLITADTNAVKEQIHAA